MRKILDSRTGLGIFFILASLLFSVLFGALVYLIVDSGDFWSACLISFFWFCAPIAAAGLLIILTNIQENLTFGFSIAMYYGTAFVANAFHKWYDIDMTDSLIIGFIFIALIAHIVWLRSFKDYPDD